jgi:hypothetical protein
VTLMALTDIKVAARASEGQKNAGSTRSIVRYVEFYGAAYEERRCSSKCDSRNTACWKRIVELPREQREKALAAVEQTYLRTATTLYPFYFRVS